MFTVLLIIIGLFSISPDNHMKGKGCPKCKKEKLSNSIQWNYSSWEKRGKDSKYFENFKVYIVRCFNESEEFIKIGKTYLNTESRFKYAIPYSYEILKEYLFDSGAEASKYELCLHKKYKNFRYFPLIDFEGVTECFDTSILDFMIREN